MRRPVYRLEVASVTGYTITIEPDVTLTTDELISTIPSTLVFISGSGKYITTGKVTKNSSTRITVDSTTALNWNTTDYPISAGDTFIVTRHPVLDASPDFNEAEVKNLTVNKTLFDFDYELDQSGKFNAICVNAVDENGDAYVSYLPAIYKVNAPGDWDDCTFIDNSSASATPDTYITGVDHSTSTIVVSGTGLNFNDTGYY